MADKTFGMSISGMEGLEKTLAVMNSIRWTAIVKKNVTEMFNRAKGTNPQEGGTPVDTGELRKSVRKLEDGIAYSAEYAPHVNYGHRTVNGGYVQGQHFATNNLVIQRPIYTGDLINAIRKEMT